LTHWDYHPSDVKITMMVNVLRVHMICVNLINKHEKPSWLTARETHYSQISEPTLSDWLYYCLALPTAYSGPPCEYRDHHDWLYLKGAYGKMKPGAHIVPALKRYLHAIVLIVVNVGLSEFVNTGMMMTEEFGEKSMVYKLLFAILHIQVIVSKLFIAFCMMESYCIACGLGYSTSEKGEEFNSIRIGNFTGF
jgi:hypothetical protein